MSSKVLRFNHSNITDKNKKKQKLAPPRQEDNGFNTIAKELRNRLITNNNVSPETNANHTEIIKKDKNNLYNAVKFLEKIREKKKKKNDKKKHNNTDKCHINEFPNNESSNSNLKESHCGILKHGKKPLWRDFHKTRKKKLNINHTELPEEINPTPFVAEEIKPIPFVTEEIKPIPFVTEEIKPPPFVAEEIKPPPFVAEEIKPPPFVAEEINPIHKNKIKLGKSKTKLRFLIKTRKNRLKSNRYTQKNLLKKHGFINSTTNAPDDIIQVMYDSIVDDNTHDSRVCNTNKEDKE